MKMSEADKRKLESEQRAIIRTTNNDLICRDCLLRMADDVILGNTSSCEQFPNHTKPKTVLCGGDCEFYIQE